MEKDLNTAWKTILSTIETKVSRVNYLTLFRQTHLVSVEENIVTIGTTSPMIADMLQKRFYNEIKKSVDDYYQGDYQLNLVTKSIEKKNVSKNDKETLLTFAQEKPLIQLGHLPRVRSEFTFDTLAVSSSNQLAFVSAQTVAKNLGTSYNPLFIYGPVGVGKTHLMHAIANFTYQQSPEKKIIYITSEEFTNEVVEAIRNTETSKMKKRFRSASLLVIDDIQFIAGKDRVQEELFHTFNILIDNGSQIVLSSDRPPSEIKKLEKRLSSRFAGGLTVDIESPDFELKTAILLKKADKYQFDLPIEIAKALAEKASDARSLEGLLLRIITESKTKEQKATLAMVDNALGIEKQESKRLYPEDIIKNVCFFYNIKPTQLKGPKRDAGIVKARQITMYLLKKELELTYVEIGNMLGGRDHTTVMHGVLKVENMLKTPNKISVDIMGITKGIFG